MKTNGQSSRRPIPKIRSRRRDLYDLRNKLKKEEKKRKDRKKKKEKVRGRTKSSLQVFSDRNLGGKMIDEF